MSSPTTIPFPAHVLAGVSFGDADLALESEQPPGHHWTSKCDAFDPLEGTSTGSDIDSDALFSQYLRSTSPSSSVGLPSECSSETLVALDGEGFPPNLMAKPASVKGLNREMGQIEEKRHGNTEGLRIRLRVPSKQPRIVLHLTRQKTSIPAKKRRSKRT
jgi:hypothetical protein